MEGSKDEYGSMTSRGLSIQHAVEKAVTMLNKYKIDIALPRNLGIICYNGYKLDF